MLYDLPRYIHVSAAVQCSAVQCSSALSQHTLVQLRKLRFIENALLRGPLPGTTMCIHDVVPHATMVPSVRKALHGTADGRAPTGRGCMLRGCVGRQCIDGAACEGEAAAAGAHPWMEARARGRGSNLRVGPSLELSTAGACGACAPGARVLSTARHVAAPLPAALPEACGWRRLQLSTYLHPPRHCDT